MSRILKTVALASATAFAAIGGAGAAEAGGKHFHFHGFHGYQNHYLDYGPRYRIVIGGGGCGYLYRRWVRTGDPYWKSAYYDCRGWY